MNKLVLVIKHRTGWTYMTEGVEVLQCLWGQPESPLPGVPRGGLAPPGPGGLDEVPNLEAALVPAQDAREAHGRMSIAAAVVLLREDITACCSWIPAGLSESP